MENGHTRRPWYRRRNLAVAFVCLFGAVLAWGGWLVYGAATAVPGSAVDYDRLSRELVESAQPQEGEDAWPMIAELAAKLAALDGAMTPPDAGEGWSVGWSCWFENMPPEGTPDPEGEIVKRLEERALVERAFSAARERRIFETTAAIAAAPRAVRPIDKDPLDLQPQSKLGASRQAARMQRCRMIDAGRHDDDDEMARAFAETLAMASHINKQQSMLDRLVGNSCAVVVINEAHCQLIEREVSAGACRAMLAALNRPGLVLPIRHALEGDKLGFLDLIQRTHSDDGNGDGIFLPKSAELFKNPPATSSRVNLENVAGLVFAGKKESSEILIRYIDLYIEASELPRDEAAQRVLEAQQIEDSLTWRHKIIKILLPPLNKALNAKRQFAAEIAGAQLCLAVRIYEAEHGKLPGSLDELAPTILSELPRDYFAPDGRFGYRVLDEPDVKGRRYLVYSVGADGEDNAGAEPAYSFDALFSERGAGTDCVFNQPRERFDPY